MHVTQSLSVFIAFTFALSFAPATFAATKNKKAAASAPVVEQTVPVVTAAASADETMGTVITTSAETFEEVTLLGQTYLMVGDKKTELLPVSHGLRKKAVFGLVPVRVYVLELRAAKPDQLEKTEDGILKSLKPAGPLLVRITFLRDLPGSKMSEAFKEGLEANGIKTLSTELEQVLKEISNIKELKKNESFLISVDWKGDQARVLLQNGSTSTVIKGPHEFAENFLSIWFGHPSDSRLHDLKKTLINK